MKFLLSFLVACLAVSHALAGEGSGATPNFEASWFPKFGDNILNLELKNKGADPIEISPFLHVTYRSWDVVAALDPAEEPANRFSGPAGSGPGLSATLLFVGPPLQDSSGPFLYEGPLPKPVEIASDEMKTIEFTNQAITTLGGNARECRIYLFFQGKIVRMVRLTKDGSWREENK